LFILVVIIVSKVSRNVKKILMMKGLNHRCFVCQVDVTKENSVLNAEVNLPVCNACRGTEKEKEAVAELLDSLADGLVCGCI